MSNYMMHRICYNSEISYTLLDKGWLSIGYQGVDAVAEQQGVDLLQLARQCKEESLDSLKVIDSTTPSYIEFSDFMTRNFFWAKSPARTRVLISFLSLEPGDIILMPHSSDKISSWGDGFGLFEVSSTPMFAIQPSTEFVDSMLGICECTPKGLRNRFLHKDNEVFDVGAMVKVSPISQRARNISRDVLSDGLRKRLKFQQTNIFCNDFETEIDELIKAYK